MNNKLISKVGGLFAISAVLLSSCAKPPITRQLFFQTGRAQILLPTDKEERAAMLAEQVTYTTKVDTIRKANNPSDQEGGDDKTISLNTFTVTAERPRVKISTIRNGRVNLTFLTKVPASFMNDSWQVVLTPTLLNGDERRQLPPIVLQGKDFRAVQDSAYARYDRFLSSIVEEGAYDSTFFDHKRHNAFMTNLQNEYYISYKRDFKLQKGYDRWMRIMQQRQMGFNARTVGRYDTQVHDKALDMLTQAYMLGLYGGDSAQLKQDFASKYSDSVRTATLERRTLKLERWQVPSAYRFLYDNKLTMDSLRNASVTERDSLQVAKHTYNYKGIAKNESKRDNKDTYRKHIIAFERIDSAALQREIEVGKDFAYMYSQDIEVTKELERKLYVVMDTRVTAKDRSSWHQVGVDTLSFIVSGINDLTEKALIDRLSGEDREKYQQGLDRLAVRDYSGALEYLSDYPDFNGAIALAGMGYNEQALKLIEYLPATGKVDYLRALVLARMKRGEEAKPYLLSAAKKDLQLAYKADIEPEFIALLASDASLKQKLSEITEGLDEDF